MSYTVILVGGSGAQFGYALLECLGHGIVEVPSDIYVVDGDRGFFDKVLKPAYDTYAQRAVEVANAMRLSDADGGTVELPRLEYFAPYTSPKAKFTVSDLCGLKPLGPLGEACLTEDEAAYPINEGLYGMAKLGGLIVAHQQGGVDANDKFPSGLLSKLINKGHGVGAGAGPILIAGSVAGGTGAGFMAPLLRTLRETKQLSSRPIHVFAFLPWFSLSATKVGIGPSNQRMALNASQGIRYLRKCVRDLPAEPATCVHLVGLPSGTKAPSRSNCNAESGMHRAEPGPLMYYVASLLTDKLAAFANVADNVKTDVYTMLCNDAAGGVGPLAGRIYYQLPRVGKDAGVKIPFEALHPLLEAVVTAMSALADKTRYEKAFTGSFAMDDPGRLPATLYSAVRKNIDSAADRQTFAKDLAQQFADALQRTREDLTRLTGVLTQVAGQAPSNSGELFFVEDWNRDKLATPDHLEAVLGRSRALGEFLKNAAGQRKVQVFAQLVVRALVRGLGQGVGRETAEKAASKFPHSATNGVTLPGQGLPNAMPLSDGSCFVRLTDEFIDGLAATMVTGANPDSQCVPSPLARAHVTEFAIEKLEKAGRTPYFETGIELADTQEGRTVLMWLGLTITVARIGERIHLQQPEPGSLTPFDIAVKRAETNRGNRPNRGTWASTIRTVEGNVLLGATSPRVGCFVSAQLEESGAPHKEPFQEIARQINAWNAWTPLQQLYRSWLRQIEEVHSAASQLPWFRILARFSRYDGARSVTDDDIRFANSWGWSAIGPLPLQMSEPESGDAVVADVWLPRFLDPAVRSKLVCAFVGIAEQSYLPQPAAGIELVDGDASLRLYAAGNVEMVRLRHPSKVGQGLDVTDELRGGAFDFLDLHGLDALPLQWESFQPPFSARIHGEQAVAALDRRTLSVRSVLPILNKNSALAQNMGLDARRIAALTQHSQTPGPFAPGLVNLFPAWPLA